MSGNYSLRRLFAAPDDATDLIATCNHGLIPRGRYDRNEKKVIFTPAKVAVEAHDAAEHAGADSNIVRLPFPATDLSWCPAKAGAENASFLSASNSQPLQLWDSDDGELRASYVATNDSDNHTHPRCCGWLPMPTGQLLAMGGYGGHEDKSPVRFFDVLYEGANVVYAYDSSYHAGASSSNNVVSALAGGPKGTQGLALAGYRNHAAVDVIDVRHRCPAAVLTGGAVGTQGCIRTIKTHPSREHLIFASGARAAQAPHYEAILCWDLRKPTAPLVALSRGPATSHQVCDFVFVKGQKRPEEDFALVSTSTTGGLYVFDLASALMTTTVVDSRPTFVEELGITSGIASLETVDRDGAVVPGASTCEGAVAVVVGTRHFTFDGRATNKKARQESGTRDRNEGTVMEEGHADDDDEEDEEADGSAYVRSYRKGRRALATMGEDADEATDAALGFSAPTPVSPNVRVVTLPV